MFTEPCKRSIGWTIFTAMMCFAIPLLIIFPVESIISFFGLDYYFNFSNFTHQVDWISICFTVGSFLFAIQSFLIPFMKQSVYSSSKYVSHLRITYPNTWKKEQFRPLRNLCEFLYLATGSAFISVIFMFLWIFIGWNPLIITSFYFGILSLIGLLISLYLTKQNFEEMFKSNENKI